MDLAEIRGLFAVMVEAGVVEVELGAGAERVRVVRHATGGASAPSTALPAAEPNGQEITSPLAGVVVEVLVGPGSALRPGRVLCVIEAAGVASEIEAEVTGRVATVLVEPGQRVEYGTPLVRAAA